MVDVVGTSAVVVETVIVVDNEDTSVDDVVDNELPGRVELVPVFNGVSVVLAVDRN
jgi:hypothetical protein